MPGPLGGKGFRAEAFTLSPVDPRQTSRCTLATGWWLQPRAGRPQTAYQDHHPPREQAKKVVASTSGRTPSNGLPRPPPSARTAGPPAHQLMSAEHPQLTPCRPPLRTLWAMLQRFGAFGASSGSHSRPMLPKQRTGPDLLGPFGAFRAVPRSSKSRVGEHGGRVLPTLPPCPTHRACHPRARAFGAFRAPNLGHGSSGFSFPKG